MRIGRTKLAVAAAVIAAFAAGSVASAASGWRVFATASDKGEYVTYASADAKVVQPGGLAVRATGAVNEVTWRLSCDADRKPAKAGLYVVSVASADSCSLSASTIGDAGTAKVELLKKPR